MIIIRTVQSYSMLLYEPNCQILWTFSFKFSFWPAFASQDSCSECTFVFLQWVATSCNVSVVKGEKHYASQLLDQKQNGDGNRKEQERVPDGEKYQVKKIKEEKEEYDYWRVEFPTSRWDWRSPGITAVLQTTEIGHPERQLQWVGSMEWNQIPTQQFFLPKLCPPQAPPLNLHEFPELELAAILINWLLPALWIETLPLKPPFISSYFLTKRMIMGLDTGSEKR